MCKPGVLASLMINDEFWALLCDCIVARRTDPTQMSTATPIVGHHKPRVHWHGSVLLHNYTTLTFRLRLILGILGT